MSTTSVTREPMDIETALERLALVGWAKHPHKQNEPINFCISDGKNYAWLTKAKGIHGEDRVLLKRYGTNDETLAFNALNMVNEYNSQFYAILMEGDEQ